MPRTSLSKVKGLHKMHNRGCSNKGTARPTACSCPWFGKHKGVFKSLSAWSRQDVDPKTKGHAEAVLRRLKTAVDDGTYDPEGEHLSLGSGQRFADFVEEWKLHYATERGLSSNSLDSMLNVLTEAFGRRTMEQMAAGAVRIERWLNASQRERGWTDNTWNRYYEQLNSLFNRAVKWERITVNPMGSIDKRSGSKKKFEVRLEEPVEDVLIAVCDQLNRPQHRPHSVKLTWQKVTEIRRRVAQGQKQTQVAKCFSISRSLCCQIVKGDVWNPEHYRRGNKGDEMRRRLYAAFDLGLRHSEILKIQLKHVDFKPIKIEVDGRLHEVLLITLPPSVTKGGKTTGELEHVYVGSERLKRELTRRRFTLRRNPDAYVFGTETGQPVKSFKRMWRELFRLAGLDYGRSKGLTWHTIRHEFVSRTLENTNNPMVTQRLARHKDGRTTLVYQHARDSQVLAAAVRLNRS